MNTTELRALAEMLEHECALRLIAGGKNHEEAQACEQAADYLRQCAEQRPDGWQLVPVEPTPAMKSAGGHVNSEWLNDDAPLYESRYAMSMDGVWSAMLAAAPAAPQAEPKREPLSEKQIDAIHELWYEKAGMSFADVVRAVERAHGIGGDKP